MTTVCIADLNVGDVVYLPIDSAGARQGPVTVDWVREDSDGTLCVSGHAGGEDHLVRLPLHLAALGAICCRAAASSRPLYGPAFRVRDEHKPADAWTGET